MPATPVIPATANESIRRMGLECDSPGMYDHEVRILDMVVAYV